MRFAIEFSTDAERDFELIFDHLFESYLAFGESTEEALDHAAHRVVGIRKAADRRASFPLRVTPRDDILPGMRFLAIGRAIYWFDPESQSGGQWSKSTVDNARSSVSTIRSHSARVITRGGDMVMVLP